MDVLGAMERALLWCGAVMDVFHSDGNQRETWGARTDFNKADGGTEQQ